MGVPYLLFQREIAAANVISATTEAGARMLQPTAEVFNTGGVNLSSVGSPSAAVTGRVSVVTAGDLEDAQYKYSDDDGSSYYGRLVDTTWDDGAEGGGGTAVEVLADTGNAYASRDVLIDSDGDGVPDRVLKAIVRQSTSPDQIDLMYTDDLVGATGWAVLASDITGGDETDIASCALLRRGDDLYLLYWGQTTDYLLCRRSIDGGTTWEGASQVRAVDSGVTGRRIDATVLNNGRLAVVFGDVISAKDSIRFAASDDGATWDNSVQVVADGSADYVDPTIVQEADDKIVVLYQKKTVGIQGKQSTDNGVTFDAYSETLWAADSNDGSPCAAIAPDGTIYVVWIDSGDVDYSKFKDGDANYSATAEAVGVANTLAYPSLANIGGALWMSYLDDTDDDVDQVMTKYWVAYSANGSWMSTDPFEGQITPESYFLRFYGSDARVGDEWSIESDYKYGKDRIVQFRPARPYRSTADEADVAIVIDMGANAVIPIDTVALIGNFEHCHVQMNATDSWGSPSVNTTVSTVERTLASATWSTDGTVYSSGAAMAPRAYAGKTLYCNTGGNVYTIDDNDAERLYVRGSDLSSESGDAKILSGRGWATQTASRYRFVRILIESQKTVLGYYELQLFLGGMRFALDARTTKAPRTSQAVQIYELASGGKLRARFGNLKTDWIINVHKMSTAEYAELSAQLRYQDMGFVPFVLIPDASIAYDFRLVTAPAAVDWNYAQVPLYLEEVI